MVIRERLFDNSQLTLSLESDMLYKCTIVATSVNHICRWNLRLYRKERDDHLSREKVRQGNLLTTQENNGLSSINSPTKKRRKKRETLVTWHSTKTVAAAHRTHFKLTKFSHPTIQTANKYTHQVYSTVLQIILLTMKHSALLLFTLATVALAAPAKPPPKPTLKDNINRLKTIGKTGDKKQIDGVLKDLQGQVKNLEQHEKDPSKKEGEEHAIQTIADADAQVLHDQNIDYFTVSVTIIHVSITPLGD